MNELQDPKGRYCAYSTGCMRDDDIRDLPEGIFGVSVPELLAAPSAVAV